MTELNPPGFLQNRTDHPARELRGSISDMIATPGICNVNDWTVTQRGAGADMSVDISGGSGYVFGSEAANQGYYHCVNDATIVNKTVGASSGTQARKDIVVARVYDSFYSGATNLWQFEVIAGAFGTGTEPAVPANSYKIATIDIAISAASILTANITMRTQRYSLDGVPVFVANQTARDALTLFDGLQVYRLDTHLIETYNGTKWFVPFVPVVTSNPGAVGPTVGTTELVLVTAPSVTVDGTTEVEVSFCWYNVAQTVGTDSFFIRLVDGPTAGSGTNIATWFLNPSTSTGGGNIRTVVTPLAGAHTYTARLYRNAGTGTATLQSASGVTITVKPFRA